MVLSGDRILTIEEADKDQGTAIWSDLESGRLEREESFFPILYWCYVCHCYPQALIFSIKKTRYPEDRVLYVPDLILLPCCRGRAAVT